MAKVKVREIIPEFDGSVMGHIAGLIFDMHAALEDIDNRERIINDFAHAADAFEETKLRLEQIWNWLHLARKHGLEIDVVYGAVDLQPMETD